MKVKTMLLLLIAGGVLLSVGSAGVASAGTAKCTIQIEDVALLKQYTITQDIDYVIDGEPKKIDFDTPANNYLCRLTFFDIDSGTSLVCKYKWGEEETYFQSDRSLIKEKNPKNNLAFRHQSSFVVIETACE